MLRPIVIVMLLCGGATYGQLTEIKSASPDLPGVPAGYKVNDILIDFEGQLFGQQMVVELTQGDIYYATQDPGVFPPIDPCLGAGTCPFPLVDTFVTIGPPESMNSSPPLVVGGATLLGAGTEIRFDNDFISVAWAPSPGVVLDGGQDFLTARLVLSDDAVGEVRYYSNAANAGTTVSPPGVIAGGVLRFVPEPSATGLAIAAVLLGSSLRRHKSSAAIV